MDERQAQQTLYQKAASVNMTVEDFIKMQEDSDHRKEMQAIDDEERADAEEDAEIEKQFQSVVKPIKNTINKTFLLTFFFYSINCLLKMHHKKV